MKYVKNQDFADFDILAITFELYTIERFLFLRCVRRPSKPRCRAQIYCSMIYDINFTGISNMTKNIEIARFEMAVTTKPYEIEQ